MAFKPGTGSNHQWRATGNRIGPGTESLNIRSQGEDEPERRLRGVNTKVGKNEANSAWKWKPSTKVS